MYSNSFSAMFSAARLLFTNKRLLVLTVGAYAGLLIALYLFVTTREATISQLLLTFVSIAAAPALFFLLQAVSVTYTSGPTSEGVIKKIAITCLKLVVVSLPVVALTGFAIHELNKVQTHPIAITALRYLLIAVVAPLLTIQLWIATTNLGLRALPKSLRAIATKTIAPQSVFVYACGFLVFAVAPYFLIEKTVTVERAWLEWSLLIVRLAASATLIVLGWVTTVGAISILNKSR